jgi:hypothetical protein
MCCGSGACKLSDRQIAAAQAAIFDAFGSPRAAARQRYARSSFAQMIAESRERSRQAAAEFDCAFDAISDGGSGDVLACRVGT